MREIRSRWPRGLKSREILRDAYFPVLYLIELIDIIKLETAGASLLAKKPSANFPSPIRAKVNFPSTSFDLP
jgi:hypothetical protein